MGKKSRNPNKKSKVERDRNLSESKFDGLLSRLPRRSLVPITCHHMTVVDDDLRKEQKREIKIYLGTVFRNLYAVTEYGGEAASTDLQALNPLRTLISSPSSCHNTDEMAQLLLATATDYLLQYEYTHIKNAFSELLQAYWVFEEMKKKNVDPSDLDAVLKVQMQVALSRDRTVYDTQYAVAKFLNSKIPCECLRDLTRQLKRAPRLISCVHCGKEVEANVILVCGRCKATNYCSKECQRENWARHKEACKFVKKYGWAQNEREL